MYLNVKVDLEVSIEPESLEVLRGIFGAKETAFRVTDPVIEVPDEAAKVIEKAIEEEVTKPLSQKLNLNQFQNLFKLQPKPRPKLLLKNLRRNQLKRLLP